MVRQKLFEPSLSCWLGSSQAEAVGTNNVPAVRQKVPTDPVTIRIEVISSKSSQGFDGQFDDNLDGRWLDEGSTMLVYLR